MCLPFSIRLVQVDKRGRMGVVTINERQKSEPKVRRAVDHYLAVALGPAYSSSNVSQQTAGWSVLIRYQNPLLPQPCIVGRIFVNEAFLVRRNGTVGLNTLLTAEQLQEIWETSAWEVARQRGELARNEDGYLSRHQARRLARRWLDQHLSMKFSAAGGQWLSRNPPLWQFTIEFTLQTVQLESLGVITVNAQTGAVTPLPVEQLHHLREHVRAIVLSHMAIRCDGSFSQ
jgi:hypothetical protein